MATILNIADAVVTELNGAGSPLVPTPPPGEEADPMAIAQRLDCPVFELPDMATLHVTVVPAGFDWLADSRASMAEDYRIDIGVQKKLPAPTNTDIDPLVSLVEAVARFFRQRRLASLRSAVCMKVENKGLYSPEHLRELHQFTSVLTLTFRVIQ